MGICFSGGDASIVTGITVINHTIMGKKGGYPMGFGMAIIAGVGTWNMVASFTHGKATIMAIQAVGVNFRVINTRDR